MKLRNEITLKNRYVKGEYSENLSDPLSGSPSTRHLHYYDSLSRHCDYGLYVTGNIFVDRRYVELIGDVAVEDKKDLLILQQWSQLIRQKNSYLIGQIDHPGRMCPAIISHVPVSPSSLPPPFLFPSYRWSQALSISKIKDVVQQFATTASILHEAGFSGVQIQAGNYHLLHQFLSPVTNHRKDEYGGSLRNRMRVLLEIVQTIRNSEGNDFLISVTLNNSTEGKETVVEIVKEIIVQKLIDIINLEVSPVSLDWSRIDQIRQLCHQSSLVLMITVRGEWLMDDLQLFTQSCDLIASTNPFPSMSDSLQVSSTDVSSKEFSASLLTASQLKKSNLFRLPVVGSLFFQEYRHYIISQIASSHSPSLTINSKICAYLLLQVIHNSFWCPRKERKFSTFMMIYLIAGLIASMISVLFVGWILNELSK